MSVYEIDTPNLPIGTGFWERTRSKITGVVQALQFSRMMAVLAQMPDEHLNAIGINRAEIPSRAHECVYGTPLVTAKKEAEQ